MKERQRRKIDHETRITIFCAWREVVGPLCTKLLNLRLASAAQAALVSVLRDSACALCLDRSMLAVRRAFRPGLCLGLRLASIGLVLCSLLALSPTGCRSRDDVVSIRTSGSYQDPTLLAQARQLPVAAAYLQGTGLVYQRNRSFCGPATVINVLRSLGDTRIDGDSVFAGTSFHAWNAALGMPLDRLADLMRQRTGRSVTVLRDRSLAEFRQHLRQINDPGLRYTINFHRGPLFGGGGGHHSPLGAYVEAADLVLVLDVNEEFKPWLVPAERLYQAMDTVDRDGGRKRGLLRIEPPK